ncbi:MAG: MarR family winged helix-turn-helix transcriptional regulator [Thermoanaerobaculia bacterium]
MATPRRLAETYRSMARLRRFFESVRRTITTEPTDGGLTSAQQFALLTLAGNPPEVPLTIGDLARLTFATMNTMSALVRRMERARLVRTTRSASDRRRVYVTLTRTGERRLRPSTAAVARALREAADEQGRTQLRAAFDTWFDNWGAVVKALSSGTSRPRRRR